MGSEKGAEGVEEGEEVCGIAGVGRIEGWGEESGYDEAVDGLWMVLEGLFEGSEYGLVGRDCGIWVEACWREVDCWWCGHGEAFGQVEAVTERYWGCWF